MNEPHQPEEPQEPHGQSPPPQQVRTQHITARVPESVSAGVFSTGVILMTGATELIIDFIQNVGAPAQVAARVVMPHAALPQLIDALGKNLSIYRERFGDPPALPRPPANAKRPTVQEIYDELKIADETLPGAYANGLMIGHTAAEFKLDFLTNLFPHSAVSCRVYMAAPQIPRMLESLNSTLQQLQQRAQRRPAPPPDSEGDEKPPEA